MTKSTKQQSLILAGYSLIVLFIFSVIGSVAWHVWTLGDDESDYGIVCLGNHQYYRANFAAKGFLGIKLDDSGNPVKCE